MPGPFTHIYSARRMADFLVAQGEQGFVRPGDGALAAAQAPVQPLMTAIQAGQLMQKWEKFTALGAIGPDLFYFCMDFHDKTVPCDEIMLALAALYMQDDSRRTDWEPLLAILDTVSLPFASVLRVLLKLDKVWKTFMSVWACNISALTDGVAAIADCLSGGLTTTLGDAVGQLTHDLFGVAILELVTSGDFFSNFTPVMQEGADEQAFVWGDMLHYRKTGEMAKNLVQQAIVLRGPETPEAIQQSEQFLAYALGYISHIGTDVTAHAYVNEQCGGPFRTHGQRHHLIENHIDAWNYRETKPGGSLPPDAFCGATDAFPMLAQSALYFCVQIPSAADAERTGPQGDLRPTELPDAAPCSPQAIQTGKDARQTALDTDGELPDWFADAFVKAMIDTYAIDTYALDTNGLPDVHQVPANLKGSAFQQTVDNFPSTVAGIVGSSLGNAALEDLMALIAPSSHLNVPPGFPLPWEVKTSYRLMLSFFKRTYMGTFFDLPKPSHPVARPSLGDDFETAFADMAPDLSGPSSSDPPLDQACDALEALVLFIPRLLADVAAFLYSATCTLASDVTMGLREKIYGKVTLPLWQVGRNIREVLVHLSFMTPEDERTNAQTGELINPSEIDVQLVQLGHSVDSAFRQALADVLDPLGHLDKDTTLIPQGLRNAQAPTYPYGPIDYDYHRPWAYPDTQNDGTHNTVEQYRTTSGPYPTSALPNILLRTNGPASNAARLLYEQAQTPHDTDCLNEHFVGHGAIGLPSALGDPVIFSAYLAGQITGNPNFDADFNLDSDRGYGYLCWDWNRDPSQTDVIQTNFRPGQQPFYKPAVWPEGSGNWLGGSVLQLHYKKQQNPGPLPPASPDNC